MDSTWTSIIAHIEQQFNGVTEEKYCHLYTKITKIQREKKQSFFVLISNNPRLKENSAYFIRFMTYLKINLLASQIFTLHVMQINKYLYHTCYCFHSQNSNPAIQNIQMGIKSFLVSHISNFFFFTLTNFGRKYHNIILPREFLPAAVRDIL